MARTDYPDGCSHPLLGKVGPEARPDLWEFCPYCGGAIRAPSVYTGDMCSCKFLGSGEPIRRGAGPFKGEFVVQIRPHEEGCECLSEGGCCVIIDENHLINCDMDEVEVHPEDFELFEWETKHEVKYYIRPVQ